MTKTLPNIANPHIGIHREIGQRVLASIEETQTDVTNIYIYRFLILLFVTDTGSDILVGIYSCSPELQDCQVETAGPLNTIFPGIEPGDFDFAFFHNDIGMLLLYGNGSLHAYQFVQGDSLGESGFNKMDNDFVSAYLNNTDAAFYMEDEPVPLMLLKGYDIYATDLSNAFVYVGEVTAPCLEKDLEENELPETFIINRPQ